MKYEHIVEATFLERPNRFIARVRLNGEEITVHVKNTGRCKELLLPGARVWLDKGINPGRKTGYDLVAVEKPGLGVVNIDSQAPNRVAFEWLKDQNMQLIRPEYRWGESRLDFYAEKDGQKILIEVKGCTLEVGGIGYFPDAPTQRGVRHLHELTRAVKKGCRAMLIFVIPMPGVTRVRPNRATDPGFAEAYRQAVKAGVEVICLSCRVEPCGFTALEALHLKDHTDSGRGQNQPDGADLFP